MIPGNRTLARMSEAQMQRRRREREAKDLEVDHAVLQLAGRFAEGRYERWHLALQIQRLLDGAGRRP